MLFFEVTFTDGFGSMSRILEIRNTQINTIVDIKKVAEVYYKEYCKVHKLKVYSCSPLDDVLAERYSKDTPVDKHSYIDDFYSQKAFDYVGKYGVLTYRINGKYLIYNQNYYNREFIGNRWRTNPCTYQRIVNLDTDEVETRRLKKLQKTGWNNV